ncbi:thermonuclease family protein [Noviherbaspirillum aridicola]|uniref:thermonuclease family protein n=1 Tax=Noviherbaspirillum aridicola TaxID=2849687 RepID=UPI0035A258F9
MANVDAPKKYQPFGQRPRQSLADLCWNKDAAYTTQDIERYGRIVAVVTCGGIEVNREQVERGMAWVYPRYSRDRSLASVQDNARTRQAGLWQDADPIAPWEFRKNGRRAD